MRSEWDFKEISQDCVNSTEMLIDSDRNLTENSVFSLPYPTECGKYVWRAVYGRVRNFSEISYQELSLKWCFLA